MTFNPNITWEYVQDHSEISWNYNSLVHNSNITWDIICSNPELLCYCRNASSSPNITWDWCYASYNPNVNLDIIRVYIVI